MSAAAIVAFFALPQPAIFASTTRRAEPASARRYLFYSADDTHVFRLSVNSVPMLPPASAFHVTVLRRYASRRVIFYSFQRFGRSGAYVRLRFT